MGYSVVHVDDIEPGGRGGAIRFVRPQPGVEAFGINWFEIPPGAEGFEHDESGSDQEEVSVVVSGSGHWQIDGTEVPVVVRGSGHWRIDGTEVPVRAGSFVRFDPGATRRAVADPDSLTLVSVGARPGAYEARGPF